MTDREKAIVMAYTGITMLTGEKFSIFHKYIENLLERPVWTHELANELVQNEIKEKSKDDFLNICKSERPHGKWIRTGNMTKRSYQRVCNQCHHISYFCGDGNYPNCPYCLADMREADNELLQSLCETCKKYDECSDSTKISPNFYLLKCRKYEEADNE